MAHIAELIDCFAPVDRRDEWTERAQEIIGYIMFADDGRRIAYMPSDYPSARKVMALAIAKVMQPLNVLEWFDAMDAHRALWGIPDALIGADVVICHGALAMVGDSRSRNRARLMSVCTGEEVAIERQGQAVRVERVLARWVMLGSCETWGGALARRLVWLRLHGKPVAPMLGMVREIDAVDSLPWIASGWRRYASQGYRFTGESDEECAVPA